MNEQQEVKKHDFISFTVQEETESGPLRADLMYCYPYKSWSYHCTLGNMFDTKYRFEAEFTKVTLTRTHIILHDVDTGERVKFWHYGAHQDELRAIAQECQ